MARRKRMIYEPPGSRKRRRRAPYQGVGAETFLTRRMFIAKGGVLAVFSGLAARLGYLQLVRGDQYKTQAKDNVIKPQVIPAPRGIILDRLGRPLAENRRSWEVRVIKADLPDDEAEERRVLDMLISALQLEDVVVIRPAGVPQGSRNTVFQRVVRMLPTLKDNPDKAEQEIARWTTEFEANYRLIHVANVSIDDAARFRAAAAELPGVLVMNQLDYLVGNVWASRLPITIKSDVPRDVALKLQANAMYMPGVEVDDIALTRHYPAGEVMSHVLGYVRTIDGATLDDLRNRDENNERIYDQNDWVGKEGLEQALEADLRGVKGQRSVEVDNNGVVMRTVPGSEVPPQEGKSVRLTIDLEFQQAVGRALQKGVERAAKAKRTTNAKRKDEGKPEWAIPNAGTAVAYDPRTGEVLAMVSYPYYDNQLFVSGISSLKWDEYMAPSKGKAFLNRAVHELYPPGSTFKIFLAASALEHGTLKPNETHFCSGAIMVPNETDLSDGLKMACWIGWNNLQHDPQELDLLGAIEQSCDTYFYNVAVSKTERDLSEGNAFYFDYKLLAGDIVSTERHEFNGLGIDPLADDMHNRFWFGKSTDIEILDDAAGLFPDRQWQAETFDGAGWTVGDTLNVSIGQGETKVTPLQLTMNTAAIANGGTFPKPHLVAEWIDADGKVEKVKPHEMGKLNIKQEHLDVVREGMRRVVHEVMGTAHHSRDADRNMITKWPLTNPKGEEEITIAGKTGTAEFGETDDLGARDTHAWFTCFAPFDEPEIAISVVIEAGGEGSVVSVPVADEILRAWLELTGKRPRGKILAKNPLPAPNEDGIIPAASPEASPQASPVPATPVVD
jgi:penicillin-binding protein 2